MYNQPIIGEGTRESPFWFAVKTVWIKIKYKDNFDKISKKEFFRNFTKYCDEYGVTWDCTDKKGNPKIPNIKDYALANKNGYFKKYAWDKCFEQYEHDQMTNAQQKALKAFKKAIPERTLKKLDQINKLDDHTDKLLTEQEEFDVSNEKKILQTEKASAEKLKNLREDLGLNTQKFEFKGNVNKEVTVNRMELVKQKRKELNDLRRGNRPD